MIWKKPTGIVLVFAAVFMFSTAADAQVYSRPRIVPNVPPTATNTIAKTPAKTSQPTKSSVLQRPALTNQIVVAGNQNSNQTQQLVKKTADVRPVAPPTTSAPNYLSGISYNAMMNQKMLLSIQEKIGIRYVYGTQGPFTFDCSGFVWSVFQSAGIPFERGSARTLWANSFPVADGEKLKFGTLVFFNKLGHVGIVADENGFYHASSSKGITYSKFEGYWGKRIVGFRRLPNTGF